MTANTAAAEMPMMAQDRAEIWETQRFEVSSLAATQPGFPASRAACRRLVLPVFLHPLVVVVVVRIRIRVRRPDTLVRPLAVVVVVESGQPGCQHGARDPGPLIDRPPGVGRGGVLAKDDQVPVEQVGRQLADPHLTEANRHRSGRGRTGSNPGPGSCSSADAWQGRRQRRGRAPAVSRAHPPGRHTIAAGWPRQPGPWRRW